MNGRIVKTVKVVIYVSDAGRISLGVLTSEHRGPNRLDRRYGPARPTEHRVSHAPRGVEPEVWLAYMALRDLVGDQEQAARTPDL